MPVAFAAVFGSLAVALVLGTQWLKGDPSGAPVVTVLGMLGLAVSQLLNNADTQETKEKTDQLSKDLRNGTFERLLRESLTKLAKEEGFPLEVQNRKEDNQDGGQGL